MLNRHTSRGPVLVDGMSQIGGPWMDSELDCGEYVLEDTLTYSRESGEDYHDNLEDTLTTSQSQPESEVNSIRFFNNPNNQSNQMRE
jgi:hypothetical protein